MARCRGSSRRAPSSRPPNNIRSRKKNIDMAVIPSKRHAEDNVAPEQSRPKKVQAIATLPTPNASEHQEEDVANTEKIHIGQSAPANNQNLRPEAPASLGGTGSSIERLRVGTRQDELMRHDDSRRDNLKDGYHTGGPSWKYLPPAPFEANEIRRAAKYKRENELFDKVHDHVLVQSMSRNQRLLGNWENSKLVSSTTQKGNSHWELKAPRTAATAESALNQLPLNEVRVPSLSPVFPIAPPRPTDEVDPLDLNGSGIWPIDFPEPCIGKPPLSHTRFPSSMSPTKMPQTERCFKMTLPESGRPQTLRERYQSRGRGAARKEEQKMSVEEMSVFIDFDAKL